MVASYDVAQSRFVPLPVDGVMDAFLPIPLEQLFTRRVGPIPPIKKVTGQTGDWTEPGQSRTIHLADGGRMTEHLIVVDRPHSFGYELQDIHGPMRPLVATVEGRWSFVAEGAGTRIAWSWRIEPTNAVAALLMPVIGHFWKGYAAHALEAADRILQGMSQG